MRAVRKPSSPAKSGRFRRKRVGQVGEHPALDMIEEGVHLLRQTPLLAWSVYLCGMAPFVVGFLFFWTEMATSGLAASVLAPASLGMACLFIWLKWTQVYFVKGLRSALLDTPMPRWDLRVGLRVLRRQAFIQPTGMFVVPVAAVLTIPFAWVFSFYQNALTADPLVDEATDGWKTDWRLARIWHEQSWILLSLLNVVGFLCWLNWLSLLMMGPYLVKALLGIETVFSRAGWHLFNSTSIFACLLLAYAVTDPLIKATYLLRRHYSESRRTGADLLLRLRPHVGASADNSVGERLRGVRRPLAGKTTVVVGGFLALVVLSTPIELQAGAMSHEAATIRAETLDASIDDVLTRREFVWRFPREAMEAEAREGWFSALYDSLRTWKERFERWFERWLSKDDGKEKSRFGDWDFPGFERYLSFLVISSFIALIVYLAYRAWRRYEPMDSVQGAVEAGLEVTPDLEDEGVSADLLPRNRWLEMAEELIAKGEYRLALRAYFLAQLAAFSSEGLIVIQRAKSNREYAGELSRRDHGRGSLLEIYDRQMRLFESVWYGTRAAGPEEMAQMKNYLTEQGVTS